MAAISSLICPACDGDLKIQAGNSEAGIIQCNCGSYPIVRNITYLKRDVYAKRAIFLIKNNRSTDALLTLLNQRRIISYTLLFIGFLNNSSKIISFEATVKFLSLFSSSRGWFWYLLNRSKIPSYQVSKISYGLVKNNGGFVADLGCGVGHTLSKNVLGIDKSFPNLFLARIFFAKPNNPLVCADLERGLPFKKNAVDLIVATDTFHYIKNKSFFLKEIQKSLNPSGILAIIHTLNVIKRGNILGISPPKLARAARRAGFKNLLVFSNEFIFDNIIRKKSTRVNFKSTDTHLNNCYAFNIFIAKTNFPKGNFSIPRLTRKIITYKNDPEIANYVKTNKILHSFDNFIFLSPHFDDVVLSCGLLLEKLRTSKRNVLVVSFFTKGTKGPYNEEATKFVRKSGHTDATKLFKVRETEDVSSLELFGAKHLHFSFIDTVFRKHNFLNDQRLRSELAESIDSLQTNPKTLILAPLGVGDHPDHLLINKLAQKLKSPVLFWEDFPYNTNHQSVEMFYNSNPRLKRAFNLNPTENTSKFGAIRLHKSQMRVLFKNGVIPTLPEKYFYLKDSKILTNLFAEFSEP